MSWLDAVRNLFVVHTSEADLSIARAAGYSSGYEEGIDSGYKKGYDATHETSAAAAWSLKEEARIDLLIEMMGIVGENHIDPISPGQVINAIKNQGYVEGVKAGQASAKTQSKLTNCTIIDREPVDPANPLFINNEFGIFANLDGYAILPMEQYQKIKDASDSKLLTAVLALYTAAFWSPDRPCDAIGLWTDVREAAGIAPGTSPEPLEAQVLETEFNEIETSVTTIEGVLDDVNEEIDEVKSLQEEVEPWQQSQQTTPSPLNSEKSVDSSKPTNDSSSSSSLLQPDSSDTKSTSTTKKRSRSNKPRKQRKSSRSSKPQTHN